MYRVLLVDDEVIIRENVSRHVPWNEHGFELVSSCQNGQEAADYITSNPVDLLITDICMPFMDGMELCEYVHQHFPHIKIVLLSGYDEFEYARKAISYDVFEYVLKPITSREMCELLDQIHAQLDKERSQNEMAATYRDNIRQIRSTALADFIIGNKTLPESTMELERLGIPVSASFFCAAVLELNIYPDQSIVDRKKQVESSLTSFVVYNVANELVAQKNAGVVCQDSTFHTIILFCNTNDTTDHASNRELLSDIMYQLKETIHLKVTIGLGQTVASTEQIPLSYSEAKQALTYRYLKGDNQIIEYFPALENDEDNKMDKQCTHSLINAVKNTDEEAVRHSLFLIRHAIQTHCYKKDAATFLLSYCIEQLHEMILKYSSDDDSSRNIALSAILDAPTLDKAMDALNLYALKCLQLLQENRNGQKNNYVQTATRYIENNYPNCDLNLKSICSMLNISVSRFSNLFKSYTGQTFMEMLTHIRMEHAKELLLYTDLKNYEIAERVGFNDPHYFGIAFKKETSKTPTEYRSMHRQK